LSEVRRVRRALSVSSARLALRSAGVPDGSSAGCFSRVLISLTGAACEDTRLVTDGRLLRPDTAAGSIAHSPWSSKAEGAAHALRHRPSC